jgi:cyanophycin synthetase
VAAVADRASLQRRRAGGFFQRLDRGTYPAHILEHVALELQSLCGADVGFGKARAIGEEVGVYRVIVEFEQEELARACLHAGRDMLLAALSGQDYDVPAKVAALKNLAHEVRLGPSTRAIVEAAHRRGIPSAASLARTSSNSATVRGSKDLDGETDHTSAIAESIAKDKQLTRQMLQTVGVPTPDGRVVTSADDAWEAAQDIGVPVVVKPQDGNFGRGVATNLTTREQVAKAYELAVPEGDGVIVERHAEGSDFRLLVVATSCGCSPSRARTSSATASTRSPPGRARTKLRAATATRLRSAAALTRSCEAGVAGLHSDSVRRRAASAHPPQREPQLRRHGHGCTDFVHPELAARGQRRRPSASTSAST